MHERHRPLLHVGFHKTGTTWLQKGLFRDAAAGFAKPWDSTEIRREFVLVDPFGFEPTEARGRLAPGFARAAGRIPVLSDERLSGSPHGGGYDAASVARRLAEVFPDGRVLIVVREQRDAILACYRQYVRDGGVATLRRYLEPRNPAEVPQFRFGHFRYSGAVRAYNELFGPESVLVMAFENLRKDPGKFLERVSSFAGGSRPTSLFQEHRYPGLDPLTTVLKRSFNRLFVRNSLSPGARFYVKDHERRFERFDRWLPRIWSRRILADWRAIVDDECRGRFEPDNEILATETGLALDELGYLVEPRSVSGEA